jgi:hypothetical protein
MDDGVLKEKDLNVNSGEDSDEEKGGFVIASQYDPAPVSPRHSLERRQLIKQTPKMVKKVRSPQPK